MGLAEQNASTAAERAAAEVAALERERDGYKARGLDDRAKECDASIKAIKGATRGARSGPETNAIDPAAAAPKTAGAKGGK